MSDTKLPKMTFTKAFLFYYLGILVFYQIFRVLGALFPRLTAVLLVGFLVVFSFHFLYMSSMSRALMIHRCFDMGRQRVKETGLLIMMSCLFYPLYPVLVFPLVCLTVVQMMRGKCNDV